MSFSRLYYHECPLGRLPSERTNPTWLQAQWQQPTTRVVHFCQGKWLATLQGDRPQLAALTLDASVNTAWMALVFLGQRDGVAWFAGEHREFDAIFQLVDDPALTWLDVRAKAAHLDLELAATLAYARGLLHWHSQHGFCGRCGAPTLADHGGHLRRCTALACQKEHFVRIEPAVIVLVVDEHHQPPRCLLARHRHAKKPSFGTLAGFVEVGESLEAAVKREMLEEVGVAVENPSYIGSQAWPFPAGLMVAFWAQAQSTQVRVDGDEIVEARWFTRSELHDALGTTPPLVSLNIDSIECLLIEQWLERGDP